MQDMLIKKTAEGFYDLVIEDSQFSSAEGFETSVVTCLFTDSRAPEVQVPEASKRRGWVGNALYIDQERELGGLLWLLSQERLTENTLNLAKSYAQDSFQWMLEDDVARFVEVEVSQTDNRTIEIIVSITDIANTVKRYVTLWRSTDLTKVIL